MREHVHDLLDSLLDQQQQSWRAGHRPAVEELLDGSALRQDTEVLLDLLYNEIVLREECGEQPSIEEYVERYPQLREDLLLHFEVHRAVHDRLLVDTARVQGAESLLEMDVPETYGPALPDYDLVGQLGQGGMAIVYRARHRRLRRHVALKMFQPGRLPSSREVLRLQTEAEAIARLQHPNIVQIFEVGQCNGLPYLALELAEQGTLAQKLQQFPFTPRAAAELIETLARAVQHAHEQQIVHRDLKPANVLFTRDGTAKISDFGLAKVIEDDTTGLRDATRTGEPVGTPRYMAPEQAAGQPERIGPTTDVYALGTLLYECMTGQAPFVAASVVETLVKIRSHDPLPPRRLQPAIPRDLETICLHCLHKESGRRYSSAAALADDLQRFRGGEPIQARPTSDWERAWKWCRRRPAYAALLGVGLGLLFSALVLLIVRDQMERSRIVRLRVEIALLVQQGQAALERHDVEEAQARFQAAWMRVQGEPALYDYHTGVAGWLDHSRRLAIQERWKQRITPREYDERRDEALLLSLLFEPQPEPVQAARQAIQTALEMTITTDPAWKNERALLVLLDADLVLRQTDAARALARLDAEAIASRLTHERRAAYLEQLGRQTEAEAERLRARQLPPEETVTLFLQAMERVRQRDFAGAAGEFDRVLDLEPEHFAARLFQALCFLQQQRPAEARVGLTACIAQRPRFVWSYLYRSRARVQMGAAAAAVQDLKRALEGLHEREREAFWRDWVLPVPALQPLRDLPEFKELGRLF